MKPLSVSKISLCFALALTTPAQSTEATLKIININTKAKAYYFSLNKKRKMAAGTTG